MKSQTTTWACIRWRVCAQHLSVFFFLFSRQQRFKSLITVIPKPSCVRDSSLRDRFHIQISVTLLNMILPEKPAPPPPHLQGFIKLVLFGDFCLFRDVFCWNFLADREKQPDSCMTSSKTKKKNPILKKDGGSSFD